MGSDRVPEKVVVGLLLGRLLLVPDEDAARPGRRRRRREIEQRKPGDDAALPGVPVRPLVAIEPVAAGGELEEPARHRFSLAGLVKEPAIGDRHRPVVDGVGKVGRRRLPCDLLFIGKQVEELGRRIFTEEIRPGARVTDVAKRYDRIDEDREVGARRLLRDRVGGLGIARVEMGGGSRGKVAAGREADDPHLPWIDPPFGGLGPDGADRPRRVGEGHKRPPRGEPVFEHNPGDALGIEPSGDAVPFRTGDEPAVAAAGADHDRGGRRSRGRPCGKMNRDEGIGGFSLNAPRRPNRRCAIPEGKALGLSRGKRCDWNREAGKPHQPNERGQLKKRSEAAGHRRHSQGF